MQKLIWRLWLGLFAAGPGVTAHINQIALFGSIGQNLILTETKSVHVNMATVVYLAVHSCELLNNFFC